MYEDFIIYEIRHKQLNSINMSRKTEEEKRAILYKLNKLFESSINITLYENKAEQSI